MQRLFPLVVYRRVILVMILSARAGRYCGELVRVHRWVPLFLDVELIVSKTSAEIASISVATDLNLAWPGRIHL